MTAHDLDDEGALVAGGGAVDGVDGFGDAVQRSVGADGHVGAEHVVVDRADQPDDGQAWVRGGHAGVDIARVDQLFHQPGPLLAEDARRRSGCRRRR